MKKLILVIAFISMISFGFTARAGAEETSESQPDNFMATDMDGILVPYEVITYAQMEYQGRAITRVSQVTSHGIQLYKLRVDHDDKLNDYDSIFLLYDKDWKLIEEEKMSLPPLPAKPKNDKPQDKSDESNKEDRDDKRRGDRKKPGTEDVIKDEEDPVLDEENDEEAAASGP